MSVCLRSLAYFLLWITMTKGGISLFKNADFDDDYTITTVSPALPPTAPELILKKLRDRSRWISLQCLNRSRLRSVTVLPPDMLLLTHLLLESPSSSPACLTLPPSCTAVIF